MTLPELSPEKLEQMVEFHRELFRWVALSNGNNPVEARRHINRLTQMHEKLYDDLYEQYLDPEIVLLNLRPASPRIQKFARCMARAEENSGGYDGMTATTRAFREGLIKFSALLKDYPKTKLDLRREDFREELLQCLADNAKAVHAEQMENKDPLITAYFNNSRMLRKELRELESKTCCAGATDSDELDPAIVNLAAVITYRQLGDPPHPEDPLKKLSTQSFFESWLKISRGVQGINAGADVDTALSRLDEALVHFSSCAANPDKIYELSMINDGLRDFIIRQMHITDFGETMDAMHAQIKSSGRIAR